MLTARPLELFARKFKTKPTFAGGTEMKYSQWTLALAAAGVVNLGLVQAEEAQSHLLTAISQTTLSGYVDTSAIWQPGTRSRAAGPGRPSLPGRAFDGGNKTDGFNLHAVGLTLEKPLDEGEWSAGYRTDLVLGPDADYYSTALNGGGFSIDELGLKQAYVALRAPVGNGIDFKVGVFDTVVGYESFESANNPNFSRSYGFQIGPRNHTGVLASYHFNDTISVSAGVANTYGGATNVRHRSAESEKAFLGSLTVILPDATSFLAGSTLYAGIVDGKSLGTSEDTTSYYAGATLSTPVEGLAVGLAYDYRNDGRQLPVGLSGGLVPASADNWAWATAVYISYHASEKLKLNLRGDYTRGTSGTFFVNRAAAGETENELGALTLTLDYLLWANVLSRLEVRCDHSLNDEQPFNGDEENALTVAANLVYKF
jgi:hypothetical protein